MAGRDGAGACTMSGDSRRGGGIDSGRVRGVGRGRRDGPANPAGAYTRLGGEDTNPPRRTGGWFVYWKPIDCWRPYICRPSCSTCITVCSAGRANVRWPSYAIAVCLLDDPSSKIHLYVYHVIYLQTCTNTPILSPPILPLGKFILGDALGVHLRTSFVSDSTSISAVPPLTYILPSHSPEQHTVPPY